MKKSTIMAAACALMLSGCGVGLNTNNTTSSSSSSTGNVLGNILGAATNTSTLGNILSSVLGTNKMTASSIVGTWKYSSPGCAFTSDNALAKAGGEVAATEVKSKLKTQYSKLGISSSNTYITLNSDKTFSAKIDGKSWSGTYTFDESSQTLKLSGILLNVTAYTKGVSGGMAILFESKKLLTLVQTMASTSGNSTLSTIGTISKSYDGLRLGFEMKKK